MIVALLLTFFSIVFERLYAALPNFGFHIVPGDLFYQGVRALYSWDKFIPVTYGVLPIFLLYGAIFLYRFGKKVVVFFVNVGRGSGARA